MPIHDIRYLSPISNVFYQLVQVSEVICRDLEDNLEEDDINFAQLRVLLILSRHDGTLTSAELSRCALRKAQTISSTLSQLKKNGYVLITGDRKDKRLGQVQITEKGEKILQKHSHWILEYLDEMLSCFTEDERQIFDDHLKRLRYWVFQRLGLDLVEPLPGFDSTYNFLRKSVEE